MNEHILITGAAGFIGINLLNNILQKPNSRLIKFTLIDSLTYASNYNELKKIIDKNENVVFKNIDISDKYRIEEIFKKNQFTGVINLAAESHNDRSISNPTIFYKTNVMGTLNLLNESKKYFQNLKNFRYLQVSTDEVYGSLSKGSKNSFNEESPLAPTSPYSSSKASADLMTLAYYKTYKLPVLITRCSNNYGFFQHEEKFIPQMLKLAKEKKELTLYGSGKNIRDWIHVDDHTEGIWLVFNKGNPGEIYNFGGNCEKENIEIATKILQVFHMDPHDFIKYVPDRAGHDWRYSMNYSKVYNSLGWEPKKKLNSYLESLSPFK